MIRINITKKTKIKIKLENVAIANALQLEAVRCHASFSAN